MDKVLTKFLQKRAACRLRSFLGAFSPGLQYLPKRAALAAGTPPEISGVSGNFRQHFRHAGNISGGRRPHFRRRAPPVSEDTAGLLEIRPG